MESLQPYETRKFTDGRYLQRFQDQDRRFYYVEEKVVVKKPYTENQKK